MNDPRAVEMKRVTPQVKKVPEAVKDELELEVQIQVSVKNGKDGKPTARWAVLNKLEVEVAKLKLATEPILLLHIQQMLPMAMRGFVEGHGPSIARQLVVLQARAVQEGIIEVIESAAPVGEEEQRRIILAKG